MSTTASASPSALHASARRSQLPQQLFGNQPARVHRVTAINHKNGAGTTLDLFSYQFDNADRVTQETSTLGPTRNYSYDDVDQLLSDGNQQLDV